jgi:hypothetical protein
MGSTFTDFRGHGFWARDGSLEVWLFLLARQVEEWDDPPEWLVAAREDWHLSATLGASGCAMAYLDKHLSSPDRVGLVLTLAENVVAWLRQQGPMLPMALLNSFATGGPGSDFTRDVPTEVFSRVGEAFVKLLRGEIAWDASTSPMV